MFWKLASLASKAIMGALNIYTLQAPHIAKKHPNVRT